MRLVTLVLLTICSTTFAQTGQESKGTNKRRTLTYYTFGMGPGQYVDTDKLYGFRMKWKKFVVKPRHVRHNRRVEKKINQRHGENWLAHNFDKLEISYNED
jgi:hypothetical protein